MYLVSDLMYSVSGILSGLNLDNVTDLYGCFERAARTVLQKADIPEASNIENLTLYSGVTDYSINSGIYGKTITDIRPQGISRASNNFVFKVNQEDFDRGKSNYSYSPNTIATFQFQNGTPILRVKSPFPPQQATIDPMNATTGWTAAGTASGLVQDTTVFYQSPASLRFNLTTGVGTLSKTFNSTSLSNYQGVGVGFLAIDITGLSTNLTSIELRIGSSSLNYNSVVSTQGFLGSWVSGNWLLVAFDFSTATTVGTPNWSALTYAQVLVTAGGTLTNFRVGGLWLSLPSSAQLLYQTAAIFLPSGSSVPLQTITATSDTVLLSDPAYNIYLYESALAILQNTGGAANDSATARLDGILNSSFTRTGKILNLGLYDQYRAQNPSQVLRSSGSWYSNDAGYGGNDRSNY